MAKKVVKKAVKPKISEWADLVNGGLSAVFENLVVTLNTNLLSETPDDAVAKFKNGLELFLKTKQLMTGVLANYNL
jgi:hypothetical protein